MLTLITGTPGAGKTLFTLQLVQKESKPEKGQQRRPIFLHNIKDVDYGYFHANSLKEPDKWYELPEQSLIVFDEAQFVFPQRKKDEKPEKVEQFAVHRHRGYDIIITTQDPMNVDVFIRRMCGRHFHIHRILGRETATVYEFDHYESNPTGFHEKKQAISKFPFKYPKKLYERYKSATQHTVKKRTPLRLYLLPVLLVVVIGLIVFAIGRIKDRADGTFAEETLASTNESGLLSAGLGGGKAVKEWQIPSRENYLRLYQPIVPGLAHTAPIYDDLWQPNTFPKPFCIIYQEDEDSPLDSSCKCYTQQITTYETSDEICRYWVRNGFFDQTKDEKRESERERGGLDAQPNPARPSYSPGIGGVVVNQH